MKMKFNRATGPAQIVRMDKLCFKDVREVFMDRGYLNWKSVNSFKMIHILKISFPYMGSFQSALTPLSPSDNLVIQKIKVKARFEINKLKMTYRSVKMATVDLRRW